MTFRGVPDWRREAGAGIALAKAKAPSAGLPDKSGVPGALPAEAGVPADPRMPAMRGAPGGPPAMHRVLRPNVRDRWLSSQVSYFTPQIVENTVRGAMQGNLLAQWLMFDLMEQTWPRLNGNLNTLKDAVVDLDWPLQAAAPRGDKPSPEAQRRKQVIDAILEEMRPDVEANENDFDDMLRDVMDAVGKGIAVSEVLWLPPDDPENELGLWIPRATRWVHPRYYGYPPQPGVEDRLMLNAIELKLSNPDALALIQATGVAATAAGAAGNREIQPELNQLYVRFPKDQFLISIVKQKSGHPISAAMLRILGFWWAASNFSWEWFLNLAQIFGVPIRWVTYATGTASASTINEIESMMATLGSAGYGVFPEGTKIEIKDALSNAKDNPSKAFIDASDVVADILVLGQTLTTTQGDRGSQSLGEIHKTVRDEKIQAVAKRTAKVLNNQLLPALCRLNFGDTQECPWFQPSTKETKDVVNTATRYKTLLSIPGVRISEQQFYEENDLVVPDEGEPVLVGTAAAAPGGPPGLPAEAGVPDPKETAKAGDAATEQLIDRALEDLTGVQAKWLGGVKPFFAELVAKAKDAKLSDADFVRALEQASKQMPELFKKLNGTAVAKALGDSMSAALVNGAIRGNWRSRVAAAAPGGVPPAARRRGL